MKEHHNQQKNSLEKIGGVEQGEKFFGHEVNYLPAKKTTGQRPFGHWLKKNRYYHQRLINFYRFVIPEGSSVLQINCNNGYLLDAVKPSVGVGIDSEEVIADARERYSQYHFYSGDVADVCLGQTFDYVILSCVAMEVDDIQQFMTSLKVVCHERTRIVIDTYSSLWGPVLWLTQKLRLRRPTMLNNWVSQKDLQNFLHLAGFEVVTKGRFTLMPNYIPFLSSLFNTIFANLPGFNHLCLNEWIVARPLPQKSRAAEVGVSVIVPCRNERGNVEAAVKRIPAMGKFTEIIFVEGHSKDGTWEEIERVAAKYPEKNIHYFVQDGKGKRNAVEKGFAHAAGDILMILDADLTVAPEELPKFFYALVNGKGDFINGSRLVYGMENKAMRFLNVLANFFFSVLFSWLLNQQVKDTLCGTKVLYKSDYELIEANRSFFGNFDPFGDFDLLFGAAKLQLKIIDMPIHYKNRTYGSTQIRRFYHGWILLGMSLFAMRKLKFRS